MSTVRRLTGAAYGIHLADQIALVAVPLVAALAFDASAEVIGILVACQSMAHLLGSIPFGIMVDSAQQRSLAIAATLVSIVGSFGAAASVLAGNVLAFGATITLAGFGAVLFVLTALSILPKAVPAIRLASANAAIEIPRAACSFAVPLAVGLVVADIPATWVFAVAGLGAFAALAFALSLPRFETSVRKREPVIPQIIEGGAYVLRHTLLLPISLCAIFWNFAFAALLVVLVPTIQDVYRFDPGTFGIALSAFGLAAICGSWLAGRFAQQVAPSVILLFGPGSSFLAAAGLLVVGSDEILLYVCFFFLGFGPSMWLIAQNSVRQLVTPGTMLGRVNAVIQTAIYGIRPLGALIGGVVVGASDPETGLLVVVLAFGASFLVSVFSGLRSVMSYDGLQAAEARG